MPPDTISGRREDAATETLAIPSVVRFLLDAPKKGNSRTIKWKFCLVF